MYVKLLSYSYLNVTKNMPLSNRIKLILLFARVNMYVIELIHRNKHFPPKSRMALNLSDMKATTRDKSVKTLL